MADSTDFSKLSYGALHKESTANTPLTPNVWFELLNEDFKVNWDKTAVNTIAGNRSKNLRPVKNKVGPFKGSFETWVEPKSFGYFLNGCLGEGTVTTLTSSVAYQHIHTPANSIPAYTIDIPVAGEDYLRRFFGARIESLDFSIEDNKLKVKVSVMAQSVFQNARVITAASSGTSLEVDQTLGLTTSDSIQVLDKDNPSTVKATLTIAAIVSETALTVSTIGASLVVGDIVVIKRQATPSYALSNELIFSGGADAYFYAGANAMQNLSQKSNVEDFGLMIKNNLEARWAASGKNVKDRFPSAILLKDIEVTGKLKQFHINPANIDILRQMAQVGFRMQFLGTLLEANSAVAATATIESDGAGTVTVTADTAGEAGNDYAVIVQQGTGALSVALSGKLITITLSSTPSNNAVATVATAVAALSGVGATSSSTGNVTTTDNPNKIDFNGGRDANEVEKLQFDLPDIRFENFDPNNSTDDIVDEEIEFTAFRDTNDKREIRVKLRNAISDY